MDMDERRGGPGWSAFAADGGAEGDRVEAGTLLVELDVSATRRALRSARSKASEAARQVERLRGWETGREMNDARRRVRRAAEALERQRRRVEETRFLLDEGVIAADEHEAAVEDVGRLAEDHETAVAEVEAVRAQGGPEAMERALHEHRNVSEEVAELEAAIAAATVHAPVAGMVLAAPEGAGGGRRTEDGEADLSPGTRVSEGQVLMRIAEIGTLAVQGEVNEIEVGALARGQAVEVTGNAFPGVTLAARLVQVAAHAEAGAGGARFTIRAEIESLDAATREALRIGMSTETTIVVRNDPAVIVAPIEALRRHEGGYAVEVANGEATRLVPVETGATTAGGVEIVAGLEAGQTVVLP